MITLTVTSHSAASTVLTEFLIIIYFKGMTKLLYVSGSRDYETTTLEIYSLDPKTETCHSLPNFPISMGSASAWGSGQSINYRDQLLKPVEIFSTG